MAEINIVDLDWDSFNEAHIWERHQLSRAEVEEVCYGEAELLYVETTHGGRYLVIGPGSGGKLFTVILAPKGTGMFYPVSARRASTKERHIYREWKAGKQK